MIRPATAEDLANSQGNANDLKRIKLHHASAVVIAGQLICATWVNQLHPTALETTWVGATIELLPKLVTYLANETQRCGRKRWVLIVSDADTFAIQKLRQQGLIRFRQTRMPRIALTTDKLRANSSSNNAYALGQLNGQQLNDLFHHQRADYAAHHLDHPVKTVDDLSWRRIITPDILQNVPAVLYHDDQLLAYLICYSTESPHEIEFGYAWGQSPELLLTLINTWRASLSSYKYLDGEFDDTDCGAMQVAAELGVDQSPVLVTAFRYNLPQA